LNSGTQIHARSSANTGTLIAMRKGSPFISVNVRRHEREEIEQRDRFHSKAASS
jgi:hypothetical protein